MGSDDRRRGSPARMRWWAGWLVGLALWTPGLADSEPVAGGGTEVFGNDDLARVRLEIVGLPPRDAGGLHAAETGPGVVEPPPKLEVGRPSRDASGRLVLPVTIRVPGGGLVGFDESRQTIRFRVDGGNDRPAAAMDPASLLQDARVSDDGMSARAVLGIPAAAAAGVESMTIEGTFRLSRATSRSRVTSQAVPIRTGQTGTAGPFRFRFDRILPEGGGSRSVRVRVEPAATGSPAPLAVLLRDADDPDAPDPSRVGTLGASPLVSVIVLDRTVRAVHVEVEFLQAPSRLDVPFRLAVRRPAVPSLDGLWQLRTASGFVSSVRITRRDDGTYHFPGSTRFSGTYELQDDTFVCVRPYHRRLRGFVWRVQDDRRLVLVDQPDPSRAGGVFLGSLLRR